MTQPKPLVIIGNGEIAAMAHQYFAYDSEYEVAAFAIGAAYIKNETFEGLPLIPLDELAVRYPPSTHDVFVAIGDSQLNRVRRRLFDHCATAGYHLASYVSSRAFVWRDVAIGRNCFILEHNVLQPFVSIGDNVTLWSGNHIGHRSVVEDDVFMSSHVVVSGFCRIGARSFVGVNAALAAHVAVGPDNYVGMGAVIAQSTEPDSIYQGNPAERRKVSATRFCRVPALG